jgi:hypothetical protein
MIGETILILGIKFVMTKEEEESSCIGCHFEKSEDSHACNIDSSEKNRYLCQHEKCIFKLFEKKMKKKKLIL